jgi:hypothetical protein
LLGSKKKKLEMHLYKKIAENHLRFSSKKFDRENGFPRKARFGRRRRARIESKLQNIVKK